MGNNRVSIWFIIFDIITLIMSTFGTIVSNYKIIYLIIAIVTCIILIALLFKNYKYIGAIIGIAISVLLMFLMISQILNSPAIEFSDKIDENTSLGNMELNLEELIVEYSNENGNQRIMSNISVTEEICEEIILKSIDYDTITENYKIQSNKIIFNNIPVGTYDIKIRLAGFSQYSGTIKLKENELLDGIWTKNLCIQSDSEYKNFQIIITDRYNNPLKDYLCDFNILDTDYEIENLRSDSEGKLPYTFYMPIDKEFQLTLYYDNDETYTLQYMVDEIENPIYAQFSTPEREKIKVSEMHQPDEAGINVSIQDWDVNEDLGINGKRYGGGIKVSVSDLFIEMGSGFDTDVSSRIVVPLDSNEGEPIFSGIFILDQTMYGSESTGTISILVNNETVFTTGQIGGNTLDPFPFEVNFGDADSLVILTEAHLSGSSFVYGAVTEA